MSESTGQTLPASLAEEPGRHRLEAELYARMRDDASILDFLKQGALDGLWYWDLESPEDEWMSPTFWRLFGFDPAAMPHKASAWQDIIHPDDLAVALRNYELHAADPSHPYDQVVRYRHAQGHTIWVRCRGIAIRDETGTPIRMLGAHTDITAQMEAQAELERRQAELEEANAALTQSNIDLRHYSYVVAHDLQAPLRHIAGFARFLDEDHRERLDEQGRTYLDHVLSSAEQLQLLIRDLLDYAKADDEARPFQPVPLETVVRSVTATAPFVAPDELVYQDLPVVRGDRTQLTLVLQNLLENARKFRELGRAVRVDITAERDGAFWRIRVADDGIGMKPQHAERIFEVFRRLHTQREYPGSGMGLAICKRIVERHGGTIWVETEQGMGSTFCFTLPAEDERDDTADHP